MINISLVLNHPVRRLEEQTSEAIFNHPLFAKSCITHHSTHFDQTLCHLFGFYEDTIPTARLGALAENLPFNEGWWLKVDPVQLLVDAGQIYLVGNQHLAIQETEVKHLAEELSPYFLEHGFRFFTPQVDEWYLHSEKPLDIKTHHLDSVKTRDIRDFLPQGFAQNFWRLTLTELQMLLFKHPVNAKREELLQPPINSVWFWGEGELTVPQTSKLLNSWGNSSLQRGLSRYYNIANSPPVSFANCLDAMHHSGNYLICLDEDSWSMSQEPHIIDSLEKYWFSPLLAALRSGNIQTVEIFIPGVKRYLISANKLKPWWKKMRFRKQGG